MNKKQRLRAGLSKHREFFLGYLLATFTLLGCASAFHWNFYAEQMAPSCYDQGTLLGKSGGDGWPDLSLKECKPDPAPLPGVTPSPTPVLLKCITMFRSDFYSMKADLEKCHADLQICQNGGPPQ